MDDGVGEALHPVRRIELETVAVGLLDVVLESLYVYD